MRISPPAGPTPSCNWPALYIPLTLVRESVSRTFDEARAELEQVIERKDRTETTLTGQLERLRA